MNFVNRLKLTVLRSTCNSEKKSIRNVFKHNRDNGLSFTILIFAPIRPRIFPLERCIFGKNSHFPYFCVQPRLRLHF